MKRASALASFCLLLTTITWIGCGGNASPLKGTPTSPTTTPTPTPTPPSPSPGPTPTPPPPGPSPTPSPADGATFVYVANNGSDQQVGGSISGFRIDGGSGRLSSVPGSPFAAGEGPTAMGSDPQGHFVFVAEDGSVPGARDSNCTLLQSTILSEVVDRASGALMRTDRKTLSGVCARAVAVDPSGKHLYIASANSVSPNGQIEGFAIGSGGTLTALPGSPFVVNGSPTGLAMHPNGRFIYVASDGGLLVEQRDPATGALVERGAFNTPKRDLALNPAGTFLAASEMNSNEISQFHVDPNTGNVEAADFRPPAQDPFGVAADPLGKFFATTEQTDSTTLAGGVSTFVLDDSTHELNKTSGSPFPAGHGTIELAFDASGTHLYAVNRQDGNVSGFVLDRASGQLTPVPGSPFAAGDFSDSLVVVKPQ